MLKNFYLKDIFGEPIRGTRLTKEKRVSGDTPLVTAGAQNEGVAEYVSNVENLTLQNMLTIDMFGNCFYHDYQYKSDDNILSFGLNGRSTEEMLYVTSVINRTIKSQYSYRKQYRKGSYLKTVISLPVIENIDPDHNYTVDDIDWQYMHDRIKELERDRIPELERDRIPELDAYLQATGLNDYELTMDEELVLNGFFDNSIYWKKVNIRDLGFSVSHGKRLPPYERVSGSLPLVTASKYNQGVTEYIGNDCPVYKNAITVDVFGNCFLHEGVCSGSDRVYFFTSDERSIKEKEFIVTAIAKSLCGKYSYFNKFGQKEADNVCINIPYNTDGTPAFDYMECYIRAIEKIVIADVVKCKDEIVKLAATE